MKPHFLLLLLLPASLGAQGPVRSPGSVRVCAGGDVALGTNLDTTWAIGATRRIGRVVPAIPDPDTLLAPLRPLVADADIVLLNAEGAIGDGPAPRKCGPRSTLCYAIRQPREVAPALRRLGGTRSVVVANVANNHARDAGVSGMDTSVALLRAADVFVTGADTLATVVVTTAGDTVAFLGFAASGPTDVRDLAGVRRHVARAAASYPIVVVTMHLGSEGIRAQRTRNVDERLSTERRGNPVAFARTAVASGARLVIGHGPHVVRAMQWQGDAFVAYSLGNLLTYGPFSFKPPLDRGGILCATVSRGSAVRDVVFRSTVQEPPGILRPDSTHRAAALVDSLGALDFGVRAARLDSTGGVTAHETIPVRKAAEASSRRP